MMFFRQKTKNGIPCFPWFPLIKMVSLVVFVFAFFIPVLTAQDAPAKRQDHQDDRLREIAFSHAQWTGVAVSREGRVFVNFPRWSQNIPMSVGEIKDRDKIEPFPSWQINTWKDLRAPQNHFICIQSLVIDEQNNLWVLDAANPQFKGVIPGGPKLVKISISSRKVLKTFSFDSDIAPRHSYLNDVRIDAKNKFAYITDSGLGAIITVDLVSGKTRRILSNFPCTKSENIAITIDREEWRLPDGSYPVVHVDGIALDGALDYLYFQALTGRFLYRVHTHWIGRENHPDARIARNVERIAKPGPADGLEWGPPGNLYITCLEEKSIKMLTRLGMKTLVRDSRLDWPDSLALDANGDLYITTSQIHLGTRRTRPFRLFKLRLGN